MPVVLAWITVGVSNPNQSLDRPFSLRNSIPLLLEAEHHRMIMTETPRSSIFPRPCYSRLDSSNVCPEVRGWKILDSSTGYLSLSPTAGYEFRYAEESVHSFDLGGIAEGSRGGAFFHLDGRTITEIHENADHPSHDREPVDRQDQKTSGSLAYTSYSRYRSNMGWDWGWGRLVAARDAAHWGPGLRTNLIFHRDAIPFNQLTLTCRLGPVQIQSLYGSLLTEQDRTFETEPRSRSVYAHRYEWNATRNLLIGVSEMLILQDREDPFAFVPVVPLFILKGDGWERLNNGSLAADFSYRVSGLGTVYSEFLIDDMQSPSSLFDDFWGNKWAWMAGVHLAQKFRNLKAGWILEHSRIEPWVYTHYLPATAQAANSGYPLGNQAGPDSRTLVSSVYVLTPFGSAVSLSGGFEWKGRQPGSGLADAFQSGMEKKEFLKGSEGARRSFTFDVAPRFRYASFLARAGWKEAWVLEAGVIASY